MSIAGSRGCRQREHACWDDTLARCGVARSTRRCRGVDARGWGAGGLCGICAGREATRPVRLPLPALYAESGSLVASLQRWEPRRADGARALGRARGGRRRPEPAHAAPAGSSRAAPAARGGLALGAALVGGCACLQMQAEGAWTVRARASSADTWAGRVLATDSPRAYKERALSACGRAQWCMFRLRRRLSSPARRVPPIGELRYTPSTYMASKESWRASSRLWVLHVLRGVRARRRAAWRRVRVCRRAG